MSLYGNEPLIEFQFDPDGRWFGIVTDWTIWWEGRSYFIKTAMSPLFLADETRPEAIDYAKKRTLFMFPGHELQRPFKVHVVPHDNRDVTIMTLVTSFTPKGISNKWLEKTT